MKFQDTITAILRFARSRLLIVPILAILLGACSPVPTPVAPAATQPSVPSGAQAAPSIGPQAAPAQQTAFRIAQQAPCVCQLPFYVAMDQGFFKNNGLNVSLVTEPTPLTGILTNAAEMSLAAPTQVFLAQSQGQDVRILITAQKRLTQALILGPTLSASGTTWEEKARALKGSNVGITSRGGSLDTDLRYILMKAGMDPDKDVTIVPLGAGASLIAGFEGKKVDAVFSYQPPTTSILQRNLGKVVIDLGKGEGPAALDQPMTEGIVLGKFAQDNPDTVKRAVASVQSAIQFMTDKANKDRVVEIAGHYLEGLDKPTMSALVDEVILLQDPRYTKEQNDRVNEVLSTLGIIKTPISHDKVITVATPY